MSENDAAEPDYEDAYQGLHELALRRARSIVRDSADAEEIAQEVLLETYTSWAKIAHRAEAWVTRVATNRAIDRARRTARTPDMNTAPDEVAEPETARLDVIRALASLPLRQRQVAVLRHVADLGETEAAGILDISVGAVKRHLHRATAALRSLPSLASGYQHHYDFDQERRAIEAWMAENIIVGPEPPGGWPAPPWDHCCFGATDHGVVERLAVDEAGAPLLDADGDEVATGAGFGFVLCKTLGSDLPRSAVTLPLDALDADAEAVFERARVIAMRFGHAHVGDDHLGIALAEHLSDPEPLEMEFLLRGIALRYDGPHADARLAIFAVRDAAGWTRPERESVLPPRVNGALAKALKVAAVEASRRGERANCHDLLAALLLPPDLPLPPPPPGVLRTMELGRENRIPLPIE